MLFLLLRKLWRRDVEDDSTLLDSINRTRLTKWIEKRPTNELTETPWRPNRPEND